MVEVRRVNREDTQVVSERIPGCDVCNRLRNLWLTGEWRCPRCGGPSPAVAAQLQLDYATACNR